MPTPTDDEARAALGDPGASRDQIAAYQRGFHDAAGGPEDVSPVGDEGASSSSTEAAQGANESDTSPPPAAPTGEPSEPSTEAPEATEEPEPEPEAAPEPPAAPSATEAELDAARRLMEAAGYTVSG